tara:strand:- start:1244 stop:1663 length:420 start_codon:yes stop_codon:yes gene_type:complete
MDKKSAMPILNAVYALSLICFLILFYIQINIKFLTNFIIIMSSLLLIYKIADWYSKSKMKNNNRLKNIPKESSLLPKLLSCILIYISPVYCIIQEPNLVISHFVSCITISLVTVFAILGIFLENKIFFIHNEEDISNAS